LAGGWKRLHNEELYNLYDSQIIVREVKSRRMRLTVVERRNAFRIFVVKYKGKRPLGRHGGRMEDNIGMNLGDVGLEVVEWIRLVEDRDQWGRGAVVKTVTNLRVP